MDFSQRSRSAATAALLVMFTLAGCGGSGSNASGGNGGGTSPPASVTAMVGIEGGTVNGPDGVQVVIPAGALDKPTEIGIARSAIGAPPEPEAYPASGNVYELTPHGLTFNSLVTVRAPIPGVAAAPQVLMASVGEDWKLIDAQIVNGMLEWQRNSFSHLMIGASCIVPAAMANDPYWCKQHKSYARVTATPTTALVQTLLGDQISGDAGSYRVDQAATLQFKTNFSLPGNCSNVAVKLRRFSWNGTTGTYSPPIVIQTKTPVLTANQGNQTGMETFDFPFADQLTGRNLFSVVIHYDCPTVTRSFSTVTGWNYNVLRSRYVGDGMIVVGNVPTPTVFYTVGGSVSGLTGAGLVLQNNGGDSLAVQANGAFSFATAVGAGAPYATSVLTQPAGQTCSVQNGSGTANAAVSNVAVTCAVASANAWQGAGLLETLDGNARDPQIAFSTNGSGMAVWSQVSPSGFFDIYARRYVAAMGWAAVQKIQVPDGATNYSSPRIALDAAGNAIIVFSQHVSEAYPTLNTARYSAASASWGTTTALAPSVTDAQLAIDSSGNAMVVYASWNGSYVDILAKRYEAGSSTWQAARKLSADIGGSDPRVAFDSSGNAIAIWRRMGSNSTVTQEIMGDRYVSGSGWHPQGLPTTIASFAAGASRAHRLAVSSNGEAVAVWTQFTAAEAHESVYASRFTGGSWGTPAAVESGSRRAAMPSVAMDANGNAIVSWFEEENSFVSVWARRYTAGVGAAAVRIDDLSMHASGGSLYATGGGPQVAMDALGNAMVVWNQALFTWANRYVAGSGWASATQIASSASGGSFSSPGVAVDANGNAIAVWTHSVISPQTGAAISSIWSNVFK